MPDRAQPLSVVICDSNGNPTSSAGPSLAAQVQVTNFPATQPVSISGSVPVTGAFWQATQPVSIAASVAVTGTFWQATQPISGTVSVNNFPATQPVSGTFWQATQPVSIASMPSTPVTGTFWQATQPVSGTVTTTPPANASTNVAQFGGTNVSTGTGAGGAGIPRVTVSNDSNVLVTPPTLTKATQGATGFSTQDLKDSGRSARTIFLDSFAVAATAETLMTMSYSTDNAAATTGTSYAVTAAKRLRIQAIMVNLHTIAGNTTAVNVIVRLRVNNGGAAIISSPIQMVIAIQGVAAANQAGIPVLVDVPDGWEFVAGAGIGVTVACAGFVATTAAPKVDISIVGYEY